MEKLPGLSTTEAKILLGKYGFNEIKELHHISVFKILLRQIEKNFMVYLLVLAAIISLFVGETVTAYTISVVIVMVVVVGFIQEYRAEKTISSLKQMIMPVTITIRDGKQHEIQSRELVPGDLIVLRNGEKVPADCILLEVNELRVNESALTGESREVVKSTNGGESTLSDQNQIFTGTFIVKGRCTAQVVSIGMETRFGKIAGMVSTAEKELPLQNKLNLISKYMAIISIAVSLLTGLLMLLRAESLEINTLTNILIVMIALSVSAFPEGLPVVMISTLAMGAATMARKNAVVSRMSIIETLGETTVICTDKTGTITRGEMTVRKILLDGGLIKVAGMGYKAEGIFERDGRKIDASKDPVLQMLLRSSVYCNDSHIERIGIGDDMEYKVIGTPTEGALMLMSAKAGIFRDDMETDRLEEKPFTSDRKMMSVLINDREDGLTVVAKGAPEVILSKCTYVYEAGKVRKLSDRDRADILTENNKLNNEAFRTLALAFKPVNRRGEYSEEELTFIGITGMEDPPRPEVMAAIGVCQEAGIKVIMITGDNKDTALSISSQIGIHGKVLEGTDLDVMYDEDVMEALTDTVVFARVRPEHKLRIVQLLKRKGEIVTMTGDGVNDAPALKEAHIGVAMGKNGTDVSRSAADLTLKDDNFATIVEAIREGRNIFNNIRKCVSYQLSCSIAELAILFVGSLLAPMFGWKIPLLLALHILFMNLVTDNLPAITLGFNPSSGDIMRQKPRRKAQLLNKPLVGLVMFNSLMMGLMTLLVYFVFFNLLHESVETSRTAALVVLILLEVASAFNFRSFRKKVIGRSLLVNKYLWIASTIAIMATLAIIYTGINKIFETVPLNLVSWLILMVPVALMVIIYDLLKSYSNKRSWLL